jgi:hypothetical protein
MNEGKESRLLRRAQSLIEFMERERFNVYTGTVFLVIIILTRAWLEATLFEYHSVNLYSYASWLTFFLSTFMGAVLVIVLFTDLPFKKANNLALSVFWVLILPPLVDYLIVGRVGVENAGLYQYATKDTIMELILPISGGTHHSWGLILQGWYLVIGFFIYIAIKNRSALKGLLGVLVLAAIELSLASRPYILGTTYIPIQGGGYEQYITLLSAFDFSVLPQYYAWLPDQGYITFLIFQQKLILITVFHLMLFLLFSLLALEVSRKGLLRLLAGRVRWIHVLIYTVTAVAGILVVRIADPHFGQGLALDPLYILHLPYVILTILTVLFGALCLSMIKPKGISQRKGAVSSSQSNTGQISYDGFKSLAVVFGLLSMCMAIVLGWLPLLLTLACLGLGLAYLSPVLDLGRKPILKSTLVGMGAVLVYFMAVFSPTGWVIVYWDALGYETSMTFQRYPPLSLAIFLIGITLFIAAAIVSFVRTLRAKIPCREESR